MEDAAQNVSGDDDPIIKVRGLRHMYSEGDGTKEVLHGIDLDIFRGEIVIIMARRARGNRPCLNSWAPS